ncbi:MAG: type II toxin-antitoxin system PemK/MazF family toxin, partial [Janthinobacterium lividum]
PRQALEDAVRLSFQVGVEHADSILELRKRSIEESEGVLPLRSKVLLMQTRSLNKSRFLSYYGRLSDEAMQRVDQALKIAAGLR